MQRAFARSSFDEQWDTVLIEIIEEGLQAARWSSRSVIPWAVNKYLGEGSSSRVSRSMTDWLIAKAEAEGRWERGWADRQLAAAAERMASERSPQLTASTLDRIRQAVRRRTNLREPLHKNELAAEHGLSRQQLNRILRGERYTTAS